MKQVLFVCSANYYRSRFAEHVFNWLAAQVGLAWRADSRGLMVGYWGNVGPISPFTLDALRLRGIPANGEHRYPIPLTASDLARAELVVAVKEAEHRPLMEEQFPEWSGKMEYWHVDDLDCAVSDVALPQLEEQVRALIARLHDAAEGRRAEVA